MAHDQRIAGRTKDWCVTIYVQIGLKDYFCMTNKPNVHRAPPAVCVVDKWHTEPEINKQNSRSPSPISRTFVSIRITSVLCSVIGWYLLIFFCKLTMVGMIVHVFRASAEPSHSTSVSAIYDECVLYVTPFCPLMCHDLLSLHWIYEGYNSSCFEGSEGEAGMKSRIFELVGVKISNC
jgi:hypothetical protein